MRTNDLVLRIAGETGDGILTLGDLFSKACTRMGLQVFTFRTYPAEVRGGSTIFQIKVGEKEVLSQGEFVDILLAFNREEFEKNWTDMNKEAVLIFDIDVFAPSEDFKGVRYGIPLTSLSREIKSPQSKNIIALGALASLFSVVPSILEELLSERFCRMGEAILKKNMEAFRLGKEFATENLEKTDAFHLREVKRTGQRLLMSGNEAICLGAIAAGCRFFAGYPITPASEILEFLAEELPRFGGVVIQTEDEIAALSAVMGASFAGQKAMTATSGPGFSLMMELIGLGSMAEIPCVIVDVQRGGPSTGLPTKTEQSDLNQALFGSHGDAPRIVIAPSSVEEAFYKTMEAFNLAEKYQMPVIILSDMSLSHRTEGIPALDPLTIPIEERAKPSEDEVEDYTRYKVTKDGISPISVPGGKGMHPAMGVEHDERGFPSYDPFNRRKMMEKRFKKFTKAGEELDRVMSYGDEDSGTGVVGWGSTFSVIKEAVIKAKEEGIKIAAMHLTALSPFPEEAVKNFLQRRRKVIVVEVNFTGQLASILASKHPVEVIRLGKYEGLPFASGEIVSKIKEALS